MTLQISCSRRRRSRGSCGAAPTPPRRAATALHAPPIAPPPPPPHPLRMTAARRADPPAGLLSARRQLGMHPGHVVKHGLALRFDHLVRQRDPTAAPGSPAVQVRHASTPEAVLDPLFFIPHRIGYYAAPASFSTLCHTGVGYYAAH